MRTYLSPSRQEVNHLLDSTGTVHVQRDVDQVLRDRLADDIALFVGSILEQLLAEIVAKRVRHKLGEVGEGLAEDHIPVLGSAFLKLLLQVATTVLILAQRGNLSLEVLQTNAGKTVIY